jgi:site-specific DNA-methyltransferase (adenine-specific)
MDDIQLWQGDCLELMKRIPDGSVDMILQDPPYNTTACKWEWDIMTKIDEFWVEWKRIIKPNGAIVMTASQPFTTKLIASNYKDFKYCWVWEKGRFANQMLAKKQALKVHEDVVVFYQKQCTYNPQGLVEVNKETRQGTRITDNNGGGERTDSYLQTHTNYPRSILSFKSAGKTVHPTQKPAELMEYLIKTYTNEGETVFDGFSGSGTTGVACRNTGRKFIGIELDPHYFAVAEQRIRAA